MFAPRRGAVFVMNASKAGGLANGGQAPAAVVLSTS